MANILISTLLDLIYNNLIDLITFIPILIYLQQVIVFVFESQINHLLIAERNDWNNSYDYIVIGAGSAGSVMAARLSENSTKTVLLLEAGFTENIVSDIPVAQFLLHLTPMNWAYETEPQNRSCLANKGIVWL